MIRRAAPLLISAFVAAFFCAHAPAQVTLRAGQGTIAGRIKQVSIEGVQIAVADAGNAGDQRLIGWDRVKSVEGEPGAAKFEQFSLNAWRARARAERGDWSAAEPLFEELFKETQGKDGPTAAMVAEGLLRCRLRRGAQGAAIWPWLEWLGVMERSGGLGPSAGKARAAWVGGTIDPPSGAPASSRVLDDQTGLSISLPPIWTEATGARVIATATEWQSLRARPGVVGELAALYEVAARFEAGQQVQAPRTTSENAAVRLVHDIVLARTGDDEERKTARAALKLRVSPPPTGSGVNKKAAPPPPRWVEAWCRVAIGRSLLRETDQAQRLRGVIELLHLPARFAADEPYLAGLALAEAGQALAESGDGAGASALLADLAARFPHHPALETLGKGTRKAEHDPGS